MKLNKSVLSLFVVTSIMSSMLNAAGNVDQKPATAKMKVKQKIELANQTDLQFPDAYQGDDAEAVLPSSQGAAQFKVTGQKGANFAVSFPNASIDMVTGDGSTPEKKIQVSKFASDLNNGVGTVDSLTGELIFHVGAERAKLLSSQEVAADYQGSFLVRVTYE